MGIAAANPKDMRDVISYARNRYSKLLQFARELPLYFEYEDFIFVHSGLSDGKHPKYSTKYDLLKNDMYIGEGENHTGKWVVVGHNTPFNFIQPRPSMSPEIYHDKKIIAIDGGNMVKQDGQINALIITQTETPNLYSFDFLFVDNLPEAVVTEDFVTGGKPYETESASKLCWPHFDIDIIAEGESFCLCRNVDTAEEHYVYRNHIDRTKTPNRASRNTVSNFLNVSEGERLTVTYFGEDYCMAKNSKGILGFVPSKCLKCN